ncbi:MAG: undecaprenyl-diphosphatase UppP [Actinobacteria bacterium]|nr:undecaprenyl-diphosphatase UppP [Actinomycetota bacterium]MBU1943339.1 undecaprenyl-diphosphatase UppP [Actinomycetota bacterium]MBU2686543.1 undecaprenyl-diphosphatase UppP [Actinomycetota bacterium]
MLALKALFLGIVQGITEFLPISSSGHLVLFERAFGWTQLGLSFNVAVHLGTLLAVLAYFRHTWVRVIKGFFLSFRHRPAEWDLDMRMAWMLVLASIPAAIVGAAWGDTIEGHTSTPFWVAVFLVAGSLVMLAAERLGRRERSILQVSVRDAGVVGCAQVLALLPGTSRSAITISTGMLDGLERKAAAEFAFLMSAPIIAGAGIWEGQKVVRHGFGPAGTGVFVVGFLASAVTGFLAVGFMMRYLKTGTLNPFVIYRLALAGLVFLLLLIL